MTAFQRYCGQGGGGTHWVNTHHVQNLADHRQFQQRSHVRSNGVNGCISQPFNYGQVVQNHTHPKHHPVDHRPVRASHGYLGRRAVTFSDYPSAVLGRQSTAYDQYDDDYIDMSNNGTFSSAGVYYSGPMKNFAESRTRTISMNSTKSSATSSSAPKHPELMKTILCESWARGQNCRFGINCWFAHGDYELRDPHIPLTSYETQYSTTQAQHDWIMRSRGRDPQIKADNRFMRDTINAQLRASVEACLRDDANESNEELPNKPEQGSEEEAPKDALGFVLFDSVVNKKLPHHEDSGNESAAEADIFSNCGSWSDLMKVLKKNDDAFIVGPVAKSSSDGSATITSVVPRLKEPDMLFRDISVFKEACPMYSVAGHCALGVDCMFQHRVLGL